MTLQFLEEPLVIIRPNSSGVELYVRHKDGNLTIPLSKQRARLLYEALHLYLMATIAFGLEAEDEA